MVNARRATLALLLALAACSSGNNGGQPQPPSPDADCCAFSDAAPVPGGCVDYGGSYSLNGGTCISVCGTGTVGPLVRTTDEMRCPKWRSAACFDAGTSVPGCL
jgi:hypothetical protein